MRVIPITQYHESTMQLAQPVYDRQRRILLSAPQFIHPKYLAKLQEVGIRTLFVEDAESRGITLEEMMDIPSWLDVVQAVQETYDAVAARKTFPLRGIQQAAGRLIKEMQGRQLVLGVPPSTLAENLRPYAHAVNVSIMALQVGKLLGYHELMLRDLAIGCLLHDIGKATGKENEEHPAAGFEIMRSVRELNLLSAHVAFQHHERMDGQGYPRGIQGNAFVQYAQVCGLCNAYENLIEKVPPHEAMEMVMAWSGRAYSVEIVQAFVRAVPAYPPGTKIRLQAGEEAIVTKITSHMQRPVVRRLTTGEEISLADEPTIMIAGSI
ncbi:HD domain-containing protein [Cohnella pontilimi]|uniref:HD domain-containing protein n=1 Tax=Cohnella pontilimi TaxID=2564100 RepID=A0A4U0FCK2_9BACL|nr:HD domain-containing phosphohydrolase [Cohnella pontilimi]TJY42606.1 HD domain-containing protein [Cohnella pontilimi]